MNAVAKSYEKIARELGVTFVTSAPVQRIIVEDGKAVGVQANNTVYDADVVVSNADYHHTETQLLSREHQSYPQSYWDKRTVAPSAFIMYMGAKKRVDLEHHNLFLMSDWVKHFDTIFDNPDGRISLVITCAHRPKPIQLLRKVARTCLFYYRSRAVLKIHRR